jgi:hypothetical protein
MIEIIPRLPTMFRLLPFLKERSRYFIGWSRVQKLCPFKVTPIVHSNLETNDDQALQSSNNKCNGWMRFVIVHVVKSKEATTSQGCTDILESAFYWFWKDVMWLRLDTVVVCVACTSFHMFVHKAAPSPILLRPREANRRRMVFWATRERARETCASFHWHFITLRFCLLGTTER